METKINIAKAIIAVMKAVKGIDKSMVVGTGASSYKGVADQDVKETIGKAMEANGLCILPIHVEAKTQVDRWEETNQYGTKMKQSVLTEVTTKYLLLHESGESIELAGYGHGVDSQDKSAGKATTYALKYVLLYAFMVPTGKIDDADIEHSANKEVSGKPANRLLWLNPNTEAWTKAIPYLKGGGTIADIKEKYNLTEENEKELLNQAK